MSELKLRPPEKQPTSCLFEAVRLVRGEIGTTVRTKRNVGDRGNAREENER